MRAKSSQSKATEREYNMAKLPEFLTQPASEKQKALLKTWAIEFNEDITVLEFRNARRAYLIKVQPTADQVKFFKSLKETTTEKGNTAAKEYITANGINQYTVGVAIDIRLNNKFKELGEDYSATHELDL